MIDEKELLTPAQIKEGWILAYQLFCDGTESFIIAMQKGLYDYSLGYTLPSVWRNKLPPSYKKYFSVKDLVTGKIICGGTF